MIDEKKNEPERPVEAVSQGISNISLKDIEILDETDIKNRVSMEDAIHLMKEAFAVFSIGKCQMPQRFISGFSSLTLDLFFKPVYCEELDRMAVKVLTQKQAVPSSGIPTIQGIVLLIDSNSGQILSLIEGAYLTALRTGAASGLATQYLARKDVETLAIFGCGAQGATQLEAVCKVRPIKRILFYDVNLQAAARLREMTQDRFKLTTSIEKDLGNLNKADIICTATNSELPLFSLGDISDGVHINAIGSYKPQMQEISPQIIQASRLFVDSREAVIKETGDLIIPITEGIISSEFVRDEIGDLINDQCKGRQSPDEITLFKSVGIAIQDLFVANDVYNRC